MILLLDHLHLEGIVDQTFYITRSNSSSSVVNQQISSNRSNRLDFNRKNGPNHFNNLRHLHLSLSNSHFDSQQLAFHLLSSTLQHLDLHTFLQQTSFFQQQTSSFQQQTSSFQQQTSLFQRQFPLSHPQAMRKKLRT